MGRPNKNSVEPSAIDRITDGFWQLLETNQLNEITVGMVSAKAGCNRGTFYYHYENIDALICSAIESELVGEDAVPQEIFRLISGFQTADVNKARDMRFQNLGLIMQKGGMEIAHVTVKSIVLRMWRMALCPHGDELKPETKFIIEYAVSGTLGLFSYKNKDELGYSMDSLFASPFLKEAAMFLLENVCKAQGVSQEETLSRLSMVNQFMGLPDNPISAIAPNEQIPKAVNL